MAPAVILDSWCPGIGPGTERDMERNRNLFSRILAALFSANRVASAVENHRSPRPSDLERLGISVVAFGAINKN